MTHTRQREGVGAGLVTGDGSLECAADLRMPAQRVLDLLRIHTYVSTFIHTYDTFVGVYIHTHDTYIQYVGVYKHSYVGIYIHTHDTYIQHVGVYIHTHDA